MTFKSKVFYTLRGVLIGILSVIATVELTGDSIFPKEEIVETKSVTIQGMTFQKTCILNGLWVAQLMDNGDLVLHYVDCDQVPHADRLGKMPITKENSI